MRMYSPVDSKSRLTPVVLADDLRAYTCASSGGHWISHQDYISWLNAHGETLPEKTGCELNLDAEESTRARICPECGRLLIKYKVGHGLLFYVDHCPGCGGVWLDFNEWESLLTKNLHDEIHKIFSSPWQSGVREAEMRTRFSELYRKRFGEEAYEKTKAFRAWLDTQDIRPELIAYLLADDPYKL